MVAYKFQMPSGIAGNVSRSDPTIESRMLDQTTPPLLFGVPVKLTSNKMKPIESGDAATAIAGLIVRPYPTSGNGTDGLGASVPNKAFPGDLLKRGYMNVVVNNFAVNAPVAMQPVYVRVGNPSGAKVIGGIEAAAEVTAAAAAKSGGNTGNGTCTLVSAGANAKAGVYTARVTIAGTNSGTWNLFDPSGELIDQKQFSGSGATAVFANGQVNATITEGATDFVVGDGFDITVTANTVVIPGNTYFTGGTDSAGNAEIAYNI